MLTTSSLDRDPIATIQTMLRRYPHVRYEASPEHVTVFPLDDLGYTVEFVALDRPQGAVRLAVNCDGWHREFSDLTPALDCFMAALSESSRLEVWVRGSMRYKWIMQRRGKGGWETVSAVGSILVPFWHARRIVYLQNHLLGTFAVDR